MENRGREVNTEEIGSHLVDWDPRNRHQARQQLVLMGESALPVLLEKLSAKNWHVRWEAAKALGEIGDPAAAEALVKLLQDPDTSVRWAGMGSLIKLGRAGIKPLLLSLTHDFHSARLRQGVHHVLHSLHTKGLLTPLEAEVFHALEGISSEVLAAQAANRALITEYSTDK